MLLVAEELHLMIVRQIEEPLALCEHLVHELLADSVIDNVKESTIEASLFEEGNGFLDVGLREADAVEGCGLRHLSL